MLPVPLLTLPPITLLHPQQLPWQTSQQVPLQFGQLCLFSTGFHTDHLLKVSLNRK